jgi:hypothetical protein
MSKPPNILADFQTYSYQHIMLVCNGYEAVKALSDTTDMNAFRRTTESSPFDVKRINNDPERQYVVLIDSSTDVRYSITNVTWNTMIAPKRAGKNKDGMRYGDTMEVDGTIDITEPYGVQLYETLANIAKDLKKDPAGLVYMLKTFCVGHNSNGIPEVISKVRPFVFNLIDINSVMDQAGTTYRLDIVGSANGLAKLPQHQMAGEKVSVEIATGDRVGSMLAKLEEVIQKKYTKWKNTTFEEIQRNDPSVSLTEIEARFQEVVYTFGADAVYSTAEYVVKKPDTESATISSGPHGTIESMIQRIVSAAPQCDKDATGKNKDNKRYVHKIISYPTETKTGQLEIRHMLHRYELPSQTKNGEILNPGPGEALEFDFMYTGKNVDVLQFDIKMNMGLSFFMTYANGKHLPSTTTEDAQGIAKPKTVGTGVPPGVNLSEETGTEKKTPRFPPTRVPLYLGKTITDPYNANKADSLTGMAYDAALTRHSALEHVEAHLKIHGNPNLLDELIDTSGIQTTIPVEGNTGAVNVTRTPSLIKVNVKFPNNNAFEFDPGTESGVKDFWYRGYYNIYSIQQQFQDGLFTQDITMFSIPVDEDNSIDKASQDPSRYVTDAPRLPAVEGRPCVVSKFPYDMIQGVKGNPNVSDEFITKVEKIADNLSTLPEWLLTVMSFETGGTFNPAQTTSASSAVGLIQFLSATANGLGTSTAELAQMTSVEQLKFVELYFIPRTKQGPGLSTLEGVYTAVLSGTPTDQPNDVQFTSPSNAYTANAPLDINGDGTIRVGESISFACSRMFGGIGAIQRKLKQSGIEQSAKDAIVQGVLTQSTLDAIRDYQILHGLAETGYVNDEVGRHLFNIPAYRSDGCIDVPDTAPLNQQLNNPLLLTSGITASNPGGFAGEVAHTGALAKFSSPDYGFKAGMYVLRFTYFGGRKLKTVKGIIGSMAVASDKPKQNKVAFAESVANALGVDVKSQLAIDTNDGQLLEMAKAIAAYYGGENYTPYSDDVYRSAISLFRGNS